MQNNHDIAPVTAQFLAHIFGSVEEGVKALYYLTMFASDGPDNPKGILVYGPPATGKTTLANWIFESFSWQSSLHTGNEFNRFTRYSRADMQLAIIDAFCGFDLDTIEELEEFAFVTYDRNKPPKAKISPGKFLLITNDSEVAFQAQARPSAVKKIYGNPKRAEIVVPEDYPTGNIYGALMHEKQLAHWLAGNWPKTIVNLEMEY